MEKNKNILSVAEQQIPFLNKNDCTRVEMACNQMRQAVTLENAEVPLIKSGYESTYTKYSSYIIRAEHDGICTYKDDQIMYIEYNTPEKQDDVINLKYNSYLGFDRTLYTTLKEGKKFKKGDILACCKAINPSTGELMLGKNLLVGFLSCGWNFEDATVISESAAKKLAYREVYQDRLEINDEILLSLEDDCFNPVRKNGSYVEEGDVLFKINISDKDNISSLLPCYREILAPISGTFYYDIKVRKTNTSSQLMNKWLKITDNIHEQIENKKLELFSASKNYKKYKNMYCYRHNTRKINAKTCTIDYTIINTKPAMVGSKIANRHGNKGVISIILPDDQMPKLPNGRPLEVILNPLGVISRMNIGQLFEIHVTWAMMNFIEKNKNLSTDEFLEKCVEFISIIDNTNNKEYTERTKDFISKMGKNQKEKLAEDIKNNGLQIIQPPFESCTYQQLEELMKYVGVSFTEKVTLSNGEKVDCSVGLMYIMRLQHEPDHKIFARSVGVYGKHEQAPAGTDAHRFGEMEVWSLLAYEAYDTIKEFLSIKADNPEERYRHFTYLYEGQEDFYEPHNLETITHETFKTYLKGCGLKVTF